MDKSRTGEDTSFGLGLAMARWISEAHGGNISVESILGMGSRFIVTLDKEKSSQQEAGSV